MSKVSASRFGDLKLQYAWATAILHADQKQASRGSRGAGRNQAPWLEARFHGGAIQVAFAAFQQYAHHVTDHVLQEAAAPHLIDQAVAIAFERRRVNAPHLRPPQ